MRNNRTKQKWLTDCSVGLAAERLEDKPYAID